MSTLSKNIQSKVTPEIRFFFDKEKHTYWLDGKRMTGVTTILSVIAKNSLIQWAANETIKYILENGKIKDKDFILISKGQLDEARTAHTRKRDKSADTGTKAHKWIEEYIGGSKTPPEAEISPITTNLLEWEKQEGVKWLQSEKRVYSEKHWYAGTLDFIAEIKGKVFIGDFKTGSGIYPEHFWQMSAYRAALEEMEPDTKIDGSVIVNLTKDGKMKIEYSYFYQEDFQAFLGALAIYRRLNNKPKN